MSVQKRAWFPDFIQFVLKLNVPELLKNSKIFFELKNFVKNSRFWPQNFSDRNSWAHWDYKVMLNKTLTYLPPRCDWKAFPSGPTLNYTTPLLPTCKMQRRANHFILHLHSLLKNHPGQRSPSKQAGKQTPERLEGKSNHCHWVVTWQVVSLSRRNSRSLNSIRNSIRNSKESGFDYES